VIIRLGFRKDRYELPSILLRRYGTFPATRCCYYANYNCLVTKIPSRVEQSNMSVNRNPLPADRM